MPGPACYGRGGTQPTVTDAAVVLGYIDPDYFLGGEMVVSPDLSRAAIQRNVCEALGLDVYEAAAAILSVAVERMVTAIEGITLQQGIDPSRAVMIGGGGGAGLYSVTIARRLGIFRVVVPDVAAALSAAGATLSDLQATYARTSVMSTATFDSAEAAEILRALRAECDEFVARAGAGLRAVSLRFSVEARYPHQVWEIEVPLRGETLATPEEMDQLRQDFHAVHDELFAVRDDGAPVEIVTWRAHVRCALREQPPGRAEAAASARRSSGRRRAYFPRLGTVDVPVVDFSELATGAPTVGPLIVESPVTTVVVDQDARVQRLPSGSLLLEPGRD
jgi:N-methylhydantoinase A